MYRHFPLFLVFLGTGYITAEEFIMLYTEKLRQEADERDLREAFRVLDKKNQVSTICTLKIFNE